MPRLDELKYARLDRGEEGGDDGGKGIGKESLQVGSRVMKLFDFSNIIRACL